MPAHGNVVLFVGGAQDKFFLANLLGRTLGAGSQEYDIESSSYQGLIMNTSSGIVRHVMIILPQQAKERILKTIT